jgi:hypothetical protein
MACFINIRKNALSTRNQIFSNLGFISGNNLFLVQSPKIKETSNLESSRFESVTNFLSNSLFSLEPIVLVGTC